MQARSEQASAIDDMCNKGMVYMAAVVGDRKRKNSRAGAFTCVRVNAVVGNGHEQGSFVEAEQTPSTHRSRG